MEVVGRAAIVGTHSPARTDQQRRLFRNGVNTLLSWPERALEVDSGGVREVVTLCMEPDLRGVERPHTRHHTVGHLSVTAELAPLHPRAVFPVIAVITAYGPGSRYKKAQREQQGNLPR